MDLFSKLDAVQTNVTDVLSASDRSACDCIFSEYQIYTKQLADLYSSIETSIEAIAPKDEHTYNRSGFYHERDKVVRLLRDLFESSYTANAHFISKIESHFLRTYKLQFEGYEPESDRHERETPAPIYQDYDFLIKHITKQTGTDFAHTAFKQLKADFLRQFGWERHNPEMKGKKVVLNNFGYFMDYEKFRIGYDNKPAHLLFSVVSYFESGSPEFTGRLKTVYAEMKDQIEAKQYYIGTKATGLRIYKNGKVEVEFVTAETAQAFWDMFDLNKAVEQIANNRRQ